MFHAGHVPLGYSGPLVGQGGNLFVALLALHLDIFLAALEVAASLAVASDILSFLGESDHLEVNELILQLIELDLSVHAFHLSSQFGGFLIDLFNVLFNLPSYPEETHLLCLVLVLNLLKLTENILFLLELWGELTLLLSDLIHQFVDLMV